MTKCFAVHISVALIATLVPTQFLHADSGTWSNTSSGGLWSDPSNWLDDIIADGASNSATLKAGAVTETAIHLDSPRSIGNLLFAFASPSVNWTLDNNGDSANVLSLSTTNSVQPSITVAQKQIVTISAELAGTQGLNLGSNGGTLILRAARKITSLCFFITWRPMALCS